MPSVSTHAIVLRHVNYRDNDRMLTLFSPTMGRIDVIARGCRKQKSSLCGCTEVFCTGEYQLYQNRDRYTLTGCAIRESYYPLREEYDRLVHGAYMLNLCEAAIQPGEECADLFTCLLGALARLAYGEPGQPLEALTAAFLLQFAQGQGYKPELNRCVQCGQVQAVGLPVRFDPLAGGILCLRCGGSALLVQPETLQFLRAIQREGFDALRVPMERPAQRQALSHMRRYMEGRLDYTIKAAALLPPISS